MKYYRLRQPPSGSGHPTTWLEGNYRWRIPYLACPACGKNYWREGVRRRGGRRRIAGGRVSSRPQSIPKACGAGWAVFAADTGGRRVENFNRDWKFARGSQAGAEAVTFNDAAWLPVRLPHDWAIAGPYEPQGDPNTGKLPWRGEGWYYGYISFRVDATDFVKAGQPNVVAVHVDTRQHNSRWYPGAGIYRKVQLVVNELVHVAQWGTFITTPRVGGDAATIRVETTVENHTALAVRLYLPARLLEEGAGVGKGC